MLFGFVLARASAGPTDSTIRNDTNHLELIRDWLGRPLREMQHDDVPAGRPAPYMIIRAMDLTGTTDVRTVLVAGGTTRDLEAGCNAGADIPGPRLLVPADSFLYETAETFQ